MFQMKRKVKFDFKTAVFDIMIKMNYAFDIICSNISRRRSLHMKMKPFHCKTCGAPIGWKDTSCKNCKHLVAFDIEKRRIVIGGIITLVILAAILFLCL